MKVVALDYGSARTGVAVSDPTGVIARPLDVIENVGSDGGMARLLELLREQDPGRIVVGLPLTLRGEPGEQAQETEEFIGRLSKATDVPVERLDERFTSTLAGEGGASDARAAAHLLTTYLARLGAA